MRLGRVSLRRPLARCRPCGFRLLPLGLVGGARITRPVAKGELLTYNDVEWDRPSIIRQLRELQDRQIAEGWSDEQTAAEIDKAIPA